MGARGQKQCLILPLRKVGGENEERTRTSEENISNDENGV